MAKEFCSTVEEDEEEYELVEGSTLPREVLGFWELEEAKDMVKKSNSKYEEGESKKLG